MLVACKECNEPISKRAKACPKCGVSIFNPTGFEIALIAILGVFVLVALATWAQ